MTITQEVLDGYQSFQAGTAFYPAQEFQAIQLDGKDRQSFLHNFCTADIKGMGRGDSTEAFILDPKGKTLFFVFVLAFEEKLVAIVTKEQSDDLMKHLSKYVIVEDVNLVSLDQHQVVFSRFPFPDSFVCQVSEGCFVGLCDESSRQSLIGEQKQAISAPVFEMIRIENAFPKSGVEVLDDCLAQEFERDETAISFEKGCYLGQETVARLDALGHTNRALRLAKCDHQPTVPAEIKVKEKSCGRLTSTAWSPKHSAFVALVMIKKPFHESGTQLQLEKGTATIL